MVIFQEKYCQSCATAQLNKNKSKLTKKQIRYAFCFFVGYIAHIVADGIIHPFIRDMVGDYHEHQEEHRVLEMKLDVLLYDYLTESSGSALNLNNTNLQWRDSTLMSYRKH